MKKLIALACMTLALTSFGEVVRDFELKSFCGIDLTKKCDCENHPHKYCRRGIKLKKAFRGFTNANVEAAESGKIVTLCMRHDYKNTDEQSVYEEVKKIANLISRKYNICMTGCKFRLGFKCPNFSIEVNKMTVTSGSEKYFRIEIAISIPEKIEPKKFSIPDNEGADVL